MSNHEDDDDDLYEPDGAASEQQRMNDIAMSGGQEEEEEVEYEEEEEDDDDDFNIIVDRPEGAPEEAPSQQVRPTPARVDSNRPTSSDPSQAKAPTPALNSTSQQPASASKPSDPSKPQLPGSAYPAYANSTIDVNANPVHPQTGKPVLSTDLDADFPGEDDKPWRLPGTDLSDYFNYGFDEFTWASYCLKQQETTKEVKDQKKQLDDMQSFLTGGPGMMGMPAPPVANAPQAQPQNPAAAMGMPDMNPEMMNQMFASMMAQGLDPSSMDPMSFMQHAQAMMGQPPQPQFGGQGQQGGFGGGGFDHNQGQGGGGYGGNRGGRGGRRGGRW